MENHKLVLPGHLNHYGYLFGGHLLQWVDECSWIAATLDYPGCKLVTIAMDRVEFRKSVKQGTILKIKTVRVREGNTSVQYAAEVFSDDPVTGEETSIFSTQMTFVRIDDAGQKMPLRG
jgi:acyl-CoA hydrolase